MACSVDKFLTGRCEENPHVVKTFIRFLHIHRAYGTYVFNYARASEYWKKRYQDDGEHPYGFIERAFLWEKTPQGFGYWNNLNDLWHCRLKFDLKIEK